MIYLASQSPRRKEILKEMGLAFRVVPSSYHEKPSRKPPRRLVIDHAVGKAKKAKVKSQEGWVLGADTIVYCAGRALGKPKNLSQAYRMLRLLSGRAHAVYTGVAFLHLKTGRVWSGCEVTKVFIKKLTDAQIQNYCRKVPSLDKAGAYAIQMKPKIAARIKGSYSNVVGLPKKLVHQLIRRGEAADIT
jgi:septum formation protein